jgi:hypothetical protein
MESAIWCGLAARGKRSSKNDFKCQIAPYMNDFKIGRRPASLTSCSKSSFAIMRVGSASAESGNRSIASKMVLEPLGKEVCNMNFGLFCSNSNSLAKT